MSEPENEPAGEPKIHYITSLEEWETLVGKPDPEQIQKLAKHGVMNFLRQGQGGDEIGGVLSFVRVPPGAN